MTQVAAPVDARHARASYPDIVDVPPMQFVMVDGSGDPNTSAAYREAVEALYGAAYGIRLQTGHSRPHPSRRSRHVRIGGLGEGC